jgi:hypothetical protein
MPHNIARPDTREDSIKSPMVGIFLCAASKYFPVFYFLEDTIKEKPPKAIR